MGEPWDWLAGRVLYQLHSVGAAGVAPVNPDVAAAAPCSHGLRRLMGWLDHIADTGFGGVLLTPIFVSSTHGYDTVDPFRIDQRLGDESDFAALVAECKRRDLKIVLDGVFNHVGRSFGRFEDVRLRKADSSFVDWFDLDFDSDSGDDGFEYRTFEGHRDLVALNHKNAGVLEWAVAVAEHWLDRGTDGWRLDAAYAIPRPFLRAFTERVRAQHPRAFLFGEMIHGDYSSFIGDTGLDSVTEYELYKALWSSLNDANFFELAWALERYPHVPAVTFVGNHDVSRIASQLQDATLLGPALALLFSLPGIPCVYYGDELGWRGIKENRPGGDDAIRPALPAGAPPGLVDARDAESTPGIGGLHRDLIGLRRAHPWLTSAGVAVTELTNRRIVLVLSAPGHRPLRTTIDLDATHAGAEPPHRSTTGWHPLLTRPGVAIDESHERDDSPILG